MQHFIWAFIIGVVAIGIGLGMALQKILTATHQNLKKPSAFGD